MRLKLSAPCDMTAMIEEPSDDGRGTRFVRFVEIPKGKPTVVYLRMHQTVKLSRKET